MTNAAPELEEPCVASDATDSSFTIVADLLSLITNPKDCARRLAELRSATLAVEKAHLELEAARETIKAAANRRSAELDARASALLAGETALAKNMQAYGMRKADLDREDAVIFRLVINARKPGNYSKGFQELPILRQSLLNVANAISTGLRGPIVYDSGQIGDWAMGPNSFAVREMMR